MVVPKFHRLVIGQEEAIHEIVATYQTYLAGLSPAGRPIGNFLFLGPKGTGKTRAVEAVAQAFLGDPHGVIKIHCSHEIANPMLAQLLLDQHHTNSLKLSFILFDEIEKAGAALWNLLFGILDKGALTLADNRTVDFSNALVFMTSNLCAAEISSLVGPKLVSRAGIQAAGRKFTPEFLNRVDKIVVFRALGNEQLNRIIESPTPETDTWETWKANWVTAA